MDIDALRSRVNAAGQSHLLQFWDKLTDSEKQSLYRDLSRIDYEEVNRYFKDAEATLNTAAEKIDQLMEPLPPEVCGSVIRSDPASVAKYNKTGKTVKLNFVMFLVVWVGWYWEGGGGMSN